MNDVPLREYLESLLDVKFEALGRALEVAQLELDRRLGQLNELHTVMLEDRHQFVTNEKVEMLLGRAEGTHTEFATRLDSLEKWRSRIYGGAIVAGLGFALVNAGLAVLIKYL